MILINILIVLLVILIIIYLYGLTLRFFKYIGLRGRTEGLENMDTNTDTNTDIKYTDPRLNKDPLYLSTLNAANISYLKEQVDKLAGIKEQLATMKTQIETNSTAITAIGEQLATTAQQLTGRDSNSSNKPIPSASGLE